MMAEVATDTTVTLTKVEKVETSEEVKIEVNGDHKPDENVTEEVTEKENGDAVHEEEAPSETVAAATEETAAEPEIEKEEVPPKVILHQFPPTKTVPNLSPFCLKLETYLRYNKIPYENQHGFKMGKKGKLPWIEYKGERVNDSNFIIEYLNEKFETKMDDEFTEEQCAIGRAVKVMLEENTYWALMYNRYIENFNEYKKIAAPQSSGIGFNIGAKMTQRKVRACLDSQGIGRHSAEEIYHIAQKDIKVVSDLLGNKDFLLGENASSFDCAVFGFFAGVLWCGIESPLSAYVNEHAKNIVDYCERMKHLCWLDWSDMVLGDKPEPIKKGFSFRKKKASKTQKPKDEKEAGEEANTTDDAANTTDDAGTPVTPEDEAPSTEEASKEADVTAETPKEEASADDIKTETPSEEKTEESSKPAE